MSNKIIMIKIIRSNTFKPPSFYQKKIDRYKIYLKVNIWQHNVQIIFWNITNNSISISRTIKFKESWFCCFTIINIFNGIKSNSSSLSLYWISTFICYVWIPETLRFHIIRITCNCEPTWKISIIYHLTNSIMII